MAEERDEAVRRVLEQMPLPAERARFFDELWEEAQRRERTAARRWRRAAFALAVVAVAAISSAAVLAASPASANVVDETVLCSAALQGGLPVFGVNASALGPMTPGGFPFAASVAVETGPGGRLLAFNTANSGYQLNRSDCVRSNQRIALAPGGLDSTGVFRRGSYASLRLRCVGPARFLFHIRLTLNARGVPDRAQLAVGSKRGKPLAFVDWRPGRVATFGGSLCTPGS